MIQASRKTLFGQDLLGNNQSTNFPRHLKIEIANFPTHLLFLYNAGLDVQCQTCLMPIPAPEAKPVSLLLLKTSNCPLLPVCMVHLLSPYNITVIIGACVRLPT